MTLRKPLDVMLRRLSDDDADQTGQADDEDEDSEPANKKGGASERGGSPPAESSGPQITLAPKKPEGPEAPRDQAADEFEKVVRSRKPTGKRHGKLVKPTQRRARAT